MGLSMDGSSGDRGVVRCSLFRYTESSSAFRSKNKYIQKVPVYCKEIQYFMILKRFWSSPTVHFLEINLSSLFSHLNKHGHLTLYYCLPTKNRNNSE